MHLVAYKGYVLAGTIALLWLLESWLPHVAAFVQARRQRWTHAIRHLGVAALNALVGTVVLATLIHATSEWIRQHGFGLAHVLDLAPGIGSAAMLLLFDAWMYWWHRFNHTIPFLWRFHRMHHSDPALDVTSALRFHPGEILLSGVVRMPVMAVLGMTAEELLFYELILLPVILLHHSNIAMPRRLDDPLRLFIVTPWMHWVHHSRRREETNSNYASILSLWDRLFGTYRLRDHPLTIRYGLDDFDAPADHTVIGLLKTPLRRPERLITAPQQ